MPLRPPTRQPPSSRPPAGASLIVGHPWTRGLIAAWLVNEGGGTRITDYGPNGFHARANPLPTVNRWDVQGPAVNLPEQRPAATDGRTWSFQDGTDTNFQSPASDRLTVQPWQDGFTVMCRASVFGSSYTGRIAVNHEQRWRLFAGDGTGSQPSARWGGAWGTVIAGGPAIRPHVQHDLALAWSRARGTVYLVLNGQVIATSAQPAAPATGHGNGVIIGGFGGGSFTWAGRIYYVYVWDHFKSPDELGAIAATPYAMFTLGPIAAAGGVGVLLRRTGTLAVEGRGSATSPPRALPVELRGGLGFRFQLGPEWLRETPVRPPWVPLPVEHRRGAPRGAALIPAEWSGTTPLARAAALAAEWQRRLRTAAATGGAFSGLPVEWTARLVTASGSATWPVEILQAVRVPFLTPVVGTGGVPVEWLGASALALGAPLPLEWQAKGRAGAPVPVDWRGVVTLSATRGLAPEWTARRARAARSELEWAGRDPFRLLHTRQVRQRLRVPLIHQRRVVESRLVARLGHTRTVREPLTPLVHSRRVLPQELVTRFGDDVQRIVRQAETS